MKAVLFDLYETLISEHGVPGADGSELARVLDIDPAVFLPGWRRRRSARMTGMANLRSVIREICSSIDYPLADELLDPRPCRTPRWQDEMIFVGDGFSDELDGATHAGIRSYQATWFILQRSDAADSLLPYLHLTSPCQLLDLVRC